MFPPFCSVQFGSVWFSSVQYRLQNDAYISIVGCFGQITIACVLQLNSIREKKCNTKQQETKRERKLLKGDNSVLGKLWSEKVESDKTKMNVREILMVCRDNFFKQRNLEGRCAKILLLSASSGYCYISRYAENVILLLCVLL